MTIPDAIPAPAPHTGVIYAAGICVEYIWRWEIGDKRGVFWEGIVLKFLDVEGGSVAEAYWGMVAGGGVEVLELNDITWAKY